MTDPEVQGRCPACGKTSLFLGSGGYVTCSRLECPEPDAASTLLERKPAPVPADVREQVAEAIRSGALFDLGTHVMGYAGEIADAVLRVPAIAEALAAVAAVADIARGYCADCGRGDAAPTAEQWLEQKQRADKAEAEADRLRAELAALKRPCPGCRICTAPCPR